MNNEKSEGKESSDNGVHPRRSIRRQRATMAIPAVDELLQKFLELNGALAMRAISPKDANIIGKNLKTVLDVQLKRTSRDSGEPVQEELVDLCRKDPRILNALVPFFTDEQVASFMDEIAEENNDSV